MTFGGCLSSACRLTTTLVPQFMYYRKTPSFEVALATVTVMLTEVCRREGNGKKPEWFACGYCVEGRTQHARTHGSLMGRELGPFRETSLGTQRFFWGSGTIKGPRWEFSGITTISRESPLDNPLFFPRATVVCLESPDYSPHLTLQIASFHPSPKSHTPLPPLVHRLAHHERNIQQLFKISSRPHLQLHTTSRQKIQ